jgi:hypothetical protein
MLIYHDTLFGLYTHTQTHTQTGITCTHYMSREMHTAWKENFHLNRKLYTTGDFTSAYHTNSYLHDCIFFLEWSSIFKNYWSITGITCTHYMSREMHTAWKENLQ